MISGTSFDAVEAIAADIELDGEALVVDLRDRLSVAYPEELHQSIGSVLPPAATTIEEVCRLDTMIGRHFAEVAAAIAAAAFDGRADLVCSHGQTVFHWVEGARALGTLQLGQPAFIAERTGATVVGDVRARDLAAGGHGAPLASLLDVLLLGTRPARARGALNLGGISNVTVVGPAVDPIAFDIGPASALLDAVVRARTGGRETFDRDGERAARGAVDEELLGRFLDEPYYALDPPKSTGKELFHLQYVLDRIGGREIGTDDLLATLTALTAATVAADVVRFGVEDLVVAGGGTKNPTMMREIASRLPGVAVRTIDDYGIPSTSKEALVFALIGFLTVNGLPGAIASCTGATHATVLGSIVPGSTPVPPANGAVAPTSLVIRTPLPPS
jgi:anhydro-N-acetylmuramic acid kinase